MRDGGPESAAAQVRHTVYSDLTRPTRELLEDVGARAQGESERRPGTTAEHAHTLFDEEPPMRSRRRRLADNCPERARDMVADLAAFDELGVDELVVVLEGVSPEKVVQSAERFDAEVIHPWRRAKREREDVVREQYSM